MVTRFGRLALGLMLLSLTGCATRDGMSPASPHEGVYRERTGQVTETDLFIRLPRVLTRHGFLIEEGVHYGRKLHFKTQWKHRKAFEDEWAMGYQEARTQLRLVATWDGRMYVVQLSIENQWLGPDGQWVTGEVTDMFESYAREIASDIRLEIASGMRRF
jgi:hypothetical protein